MQELLRAWRALAAQRAASRRMSNIVRKARDKYNERIEEEMHEAAYRGDYAEVWRLVRARTGRKMGHKTKSAAARRSLNA